jgi:hypothetical protein
MIDTLALFLLAIVLTLFGIGPALWLVSPGRKRVLYAFAIAPALGFTLFGIINFPLVRYFAPVHRWALAVTVLLVLTSLALAARDWQQRRGDYAIIGQQRRAVAFTPGFIALGYFV